MSENADAWSSEAKVAVVIGTWYISSEDQPLVLVHNPLVDDLSSKRVRFHVGLMRYSRPSDANLALI